MKSKPKIAVIDYNMGNLRSVSKALEVVGADTVVTSNPRTVTSLDAAVFPGVGAFCHAIDYLQQKKLDSAIEKVISTRKPFLGLCLGFQLLFDYSQEDGIHKGLGIVPGYVKRFNSGRLKVPHMGWNSVKYRRNSNTAKMFKGVPNKSYFYFVHSYYGVPKGSDFVASSTDYGIEFCSSVIKDNIWAFQFHPEKSSTLGLKILKNFVSEVKKC